jgi:hypothetical protein
MQSCMSKDFHVVQALNVHSCCVYQLTTLRRNTCQQKTLLFRFCRMAQSLGSCPSWVMVRCWYARGTRWQMQWPVLGRPCANGHISAICPCWRTSAATGSSVSTIWTSSLPRSRTSNNANAPSGAH